ncbi:MAG: ParA family protein [Nitrospinae bacterium]|nr:ParA family protein [Nitrospinota bacterium]
MKKMAVISSKGGVGKTTFSFHLSHLLAREGLRTLAVDMDPQGSLSFVFFGANKRPGIPEIHQRRKVLPAPVNPLLSVLTTAPSAADIRWEEAGLGDMLDSVIADWGVTPDWIVVDAPSSITSATKSILKSVDFIVVPSDLTTLSLRGMVQLLKLNPLPWKVLPMRIVPTQRNTAEGRARLLEALTSRNLDPADYILPDITRRVAVDHAMSASVPVWQEKRYRDSQAIGEFTNAIHAVAGISGSMQ